MDIADVYVYLYNRIPFELRLVCLKPAEYHDAHATSEPCGLEVVDEPFSRIIEHHYPQEISTSYMLVVITEFPVELCA